MKRRKVLIDRTVQGSLAWRYLMHWVAFGASLFVFFVILQVLKEPFRTPGEHVQALLRDHGTVFVMLLAMTPAFVWDAMKLSHRFAGPITKLRQGMRKLAENEQTEEMQFRGGDFWRELAVYFNQIRERVESAPAGQADETQITRSEQSPIRIGNEQALSDSPCREEVGIGS